MEGRGREPRRRSVRNWIGNHFIGLTLLAIIVIVAVVMISAVSIVTVPAGYKGVVVSAPNRDFIGTTLNEGWHMNPYFVLCDIEIIRYNSQSVEFIGGDMSDDNVGSIGVRSADNLELFIDFSITYHLPADKVSEIRVTYGDYQHTILTQVCRSVPRDVSSRYLALDIAGTNRSLLEHDIRTNITEKLGNFNIIVDSFNLRDIRLPADVDAAIQAKKAAEQHLIRAGYEAQTKIVLAEGNKTATIINAEGSALARVVQANGSAEAVRIIMEMFRAQDPSATNLTEVYLTWLYIQALTDPNSNIAWIIIQPAGGGVPIIINPNG